MEDVKIEITMKTDADLSILLDIVEGYLASLADEIFDHEYEVEDADSIHVSVAYADHPHGHCP